MEFVYTHHPQTAKWIENNLVFGDSPADFMYHIERNAVQKGVQEMTIKLFKTFQNTTNFKSKNKKNVTRQYIIEYMMICSPFPGFLKRPQYITEIHEEFSEYVDMKDFFKVLHADGCEHCAEYIKAYYFEDLYDVKESDEDYEDFAEDREKYKKMCSDIGIEL
jgi:hypothetical protein